MPVFDRVKASFKLRTWEPIIMVVAPVMAVLTLADMSRTGWASAGPLMALMEVSRPMRAVLTLPRPLWMVAKSRLVMSTDGAAKAEPKRARERTALYSMVKV